MNVLLVSAHPDDMEIGMGGTAAKLAERGDSLTSVILTDGRRSPNPFNLQPEVLAQIREEEARKAATLLGVKEIIACGFPDLVSAENYSTAKQMIKELISKIQPGEIYTLHPELDRHPSHRLAGKMLLESMEECEVQCDVWAYEVWGLFNQWHRIEDISAQIGKKIQAISEHKSQVACISYAEGVTGLNRWRAIFADPQQTKSGTAFAEAFIRCSILDSKKTE